MRPVALLLLLLGVALGGASSVAGPPPPGGAGRPGYGGGHWGGGGHGHWGGRHYRPVYGPGYGYGRGFYGYPGYGYGLGFGWGYGTGWALSAGYPWVYGGAPGVWGYPYSGYPYAGYPYAGYPYGYAGSAAPMLAPSEDLVFVQQAPAEAATPAPQEPGSGYWYYCTGPAGYYPYVQQCNKPWIAVPPQAAPPAR